MSRCRVAAGLCEPLSCRSSRGSRGPRPAIPLHLGAWSFRTPAFGVGWEPATRTYTRWCSAAAAGRWGLEVDLSRLHHGRGYSVRLEGLLPAPGNQTGGAPSELIRVGVEAAAAVTKVSPAEAWGRFDFSIVVEEAA